MRGGVRDRCASARPPRFADFSSATRRCAEPIGFAPRNALRRNGFVSLGRSGGTGSGPVAPRCSGSVRPGAPRPKRRFRFDGNEIRRPHWLRSAPGAGSDRLRFARTIPGRLGLDRAEARPARGERLPGPSGRRRPLAVRRAWSARCAGEEGRPGVDSRVGGTRYVDGRGFVSGTRLHRGGSDQCETSPGSGLDRGPGDARRVLAVRQGRSERPTDGRDARRRAIRGHRRGPRAAMPRINIIVECGHSSQENREAEGTGPGPRRAWGPTGGPPGTIEADPGLGSGRRRHLPEDPGRPSGHERARARRREGCPRSTCRARSELREVRPPLRLAPPAS